MLLWAECVLLTGAALSEPLRVSGTFNDKKILSKSLKLPTFLLGICPLYIVAKCEMYINKNILLQRNGRKCCGDVLVK